MVLRNVWGLMDSGLFVSRSEPNHLRMQEGRPLVLQGPARLFALGAASPVRFRAPLVYLDYS